VPILPVPQAVYSRYAIVVKRVYAAQAPKDGNVRLRLTCDTVASLDG